MRTAILTQTDNFDIALWVTLYSKYSTYLPLKMIHSDTGNKSWIGSNGHMVRNLKNQWNSMCFTTKYVFWLWQFNLLWTQFFGNKCQKWNLNQSREFVAAISSLWLNVITIDKRLLDCEIIFWIFSFLISIKLCVQIQGTESEVELDNIHLHVGTWIENKKKKLYATVILFVYVFGGGRGVIGISGSLIW